MLFDSKETKEKKRRIAELDKLSREAEIAADKLEEKRLQREYVDEIMADHREKAEANLRKYKANRKIMYTMPHYTRVQILNDTQAERVPGGWIFYKEETKEEAAGTTFVPFTEESDETFYNLKNSSFNE